MKPFRYCVVVLLMLATFALRAQNISYHLIPQYDTVYVDTTEIAQGYYLVKHQLFDDSSIIGPGYLSFIPKYNPNNLDIKFTPQNIAKEQLASYNKYLLSINDEADRYHNLADKMVADAMHQYTVNNINSVDYTWSEIPEPWRDITERRKRKSQNSDSHSLAHYFSGEADYYSNTNLAKRPEPKKSCWTISGQENIQLTQLAVRNWVKGGENAITILNDFRYKAQFDKNRHSWETNFTEKLGFTRTSTLSTRVSDDAFEFSSKYGYQAIKSWYYSFQYNFKTQLFRSYSRNDAEKKKPLSTLLSPAYMQFIFGMDYKRDKLSILLSPYTGMLTIVADTALIDQTQYSIAENRRSKFVNGYSVTINWTKPIVYNVTYSTQCELFMEFLSKRGQKQFNWENVFDVQITRFLTTRFLSVLRYYENESRKFQIKENYSIAFKYTFS